MFICRTQKTHVWSNRESVADTSGIYCKQCDVNGGNISTSWKPLRNYFPAERRIMTEEERQKEKQLRVVIKAAANETALTQKS